jgi:hypothetical protein
MPTNTTVFARAIVEIAHTTNHCGKSYSHLSPIAQKILSEVLPAACAVTGKQVEVTMQDPLVEYDASRRSAEMRDALLVARGGLCVRALKDGTLEQINKALGET